MSEKRIVGVMLKVTLAVALILMIGHLLVYVTYTARLVQFPFDYDQGEGFELNDTVLLSQGQWPYRDNAVYPFYASNYPPLFHVLLVPFVWLFGAQYWYGRLAGFIATLITAAAIGYAVQRETRQRAIALLAGLAYLASNYIYHIGPLFRQHITMVMFETLAIVAYMQPVTKSEVEGVRGVSADSVIATLVDRRFLVEGGRKEVAGRPILYKTTAEFLEAFGLRSLEELPPIDIDAGLPIEMALPIPTETVATAIDEIVADEITEEARLSDAPAGDIVEETTEESETTESTPT